MSVKLSATARKADSQQSSEVNATHLCSSCKYDLSHLHEHSTCPECGYPITESISKNDIPIYYRVMHVAGAAFSGIVFGIGLTYITFCLQSILKDVAIWNWISLIALWIAGILTGFAVVTCLICVSISLITAKIAYEIRYAKHNKLTC